LRKRAPAPIARNGARVSVAGRLEDALRKGFHEFSEKPKRFYKTVEVGPTDGGFLVLLDGRNVRTPKGEKLILPTQALADLVSEEWAAQTDVIEMGHMHATRLAHTAYEAIPPARDETADTIAQYAGSDLLCYYAEAPSALVERQTARWEPILARAEQELTLAFVRASGILHRDQPAQTLAKIKAMALELDDFGLAGLAFGTSLFGSAVLAFALQRGWLEGEQALELSRLDEIFQEEAWGIDEEAAERVALLRLEAIMLDRWFRALA
jgi:chaperone required for assembly of F1-ATPase